MGTAAFFLVGPVAGGALVPWLLTGWRLRPAPAWYLPVRVLGAVLVVVGAAFVVSAYVRFAREGRGTPAPFAPPDRLVVGGEYRYVRNPMYVAVTATILGQALLLWRPVLLIYAAVVATAFVAFVLGYEQPTLSRQFGASYEAYRRAVPAWWPRWRPWHPDYDGRSDRDVRG